MLNKTAPAAVSRRRALLPAALKSGIARNEAPTPSLADVMATVNQITAAVTALRTANDSRLAALEKGRDDIVAKELVDRINADVEKHQSQLAELNNKIEAAARAPRQTGDETPEASAHRNAYKNFLRKGVENGLRDLEFKAALATDTDTDGGFVVPVEVDRAITRVLGTQNGMRSLAAQQTIGTDSFKQFKNLGGGTSGWVGERDSRPQTNTPQLVAQEFPVHEMYAMPASTQKVLDDAFIDIESWLAEEVAISFADKEGDAFINGDGASKPYGLFGSAYTKAASTIAAPSAWGKIGFTVSGGAADFASSSPGDALINLQESLKPGYLSGASWLMNRATRAKIRLFKDGQGNYLWQQGLGGAPDSLLGFPIAIDDNVPSVGSNTFPVAFGNFKLGYKIIDRMGTRVLRDPFSSKPYVLFYTTRRVGGGVSDYHAIKLLKCAAS